MHEISPLVKKHGDRWAASLKDKESRKNWARDTRFWSLCRLMVSLTFIQPLKAMSYKKVIKIVIKKRIINYFFSTLPSLRCRDQPLSCVCSLTILDSSQVRQQCLPPLLSLPLHLSSLTYKAPFHFPLFSLSPLPPLFPSLLALPSLSHSKGVRGGGIVSLQRGSSSPLWPLSRQCLDPLKQQHATGYWPDGRLKLL